MRILLAEDHPSVVKATEMMMDTWGYNLEVASNGQEAVEKFKKQRYDCCLMDMQMPVMDGIKATRLIRAEKRKYYMPIIAVTACSLLDIGFDGYYAGLDDYLEKPFDFCKLKEKIIDFSVKRVTIRRIQGKTTVEKVSPMSKQELNELRELDKKGLAKFSLIDTGHIFIVHKNVQNKISHDFIFKGKKLSEFLDRSEEAPGNIHLYEFNHRANKKFLTPEQYKELAKQEDQDIEKHKKVYEYPEKEDGKES